MRLKALSLGYAIPDSDFLAHIHSVFTSTMNLKVDESTDLITLINSNETDLPQGIRVDDPTNFAFNGFQVNGQVGCQAGILRFAGSELEIDLTRAERWQCDLRHLCNEGDPERFLVSWNLVWKILNDRQIEFKADIIADSVINPREGSPSLFSERLNDGISTILRSAGKLDPGLANEAVSILVGLGAGLTPAGDDFLIGFMTGLICRSGSDRNRELYIARLGETIQSNLKRTNDISRTYLKHAGLGQVSRNLAELAEAICGGWNDDRLYVRMKSAMNTGHSSGMDTVTGLLVGLGVWDGNQ